mgnify:CR=1 FL=1
MRRTSLSSKLLLAALPLVAATGALLVLLATICYGIALNVVAPLQRKYGALPVLLRVQAVAIVLTLVPGTIAATDSTFSWASLLVLVPLGCLGTGLAFLAMSTLVGRVGGFCTTLPSFSLWP